MAKDIEAIIADLRARGYEVEVKADEPTEPTKYRVVMPVLPICDYMKASELETWYHGLVPETKRR